MSANAFLLTPFPYRMLKTEGQSVGSFKILRGEINFTRFMAKRLSVSVFFFDDDMAFELRSVSLSAERINALTVINSVPSSE